MCPLQHVQTSVGRSWLLEASHGSLGWVFCFQHWLSACCHDAYCTCRPPTQPLLQSLLQSFVWPYSPLGWIHTFILCLLGCPPTLDSVHDLLPYCQGCQWLLGSCGFLSLCQLGEKSLHMGYSTCLDTTRPEFPGTLFIWLLLTRYKRQLQWLLHVSAVCLCSLLTPRVLVLLPTVLDHRPPFVQFRGCCGTFSSCLCACILLQLQPCHHRIGIYPSTTSRPPPHFHLSHCHPLCHFSIICGIITQGDYLGCQRLVQAWAAHVLCPSSLFMFIFDDSAYRYTRYGVVVQFL